MVLLSLQSALAENSTLDELYRKALAQSEMLMQQKESVQQAHERYSELFASVLPTVRITGVQSFRNSTNAGGGFIVDGGLRGNARERTELALALRQPLFSGFREFLIADAAQADIAGRGHDLIRARELLYFDVAQTFYQVAALQEDRAVLTSTELILLNRITELRRLMKLGRARSSEVLQAEADLAENRATDARTVGLIAGSKEFLSFLTGVPSTELECVALPHVRESSNLEMLIEQGSQRADLSALQAAVVSRSYIATAAGREHLPSFTLEANRYPYEHPDTNREWDVFIRMDAPLFVGGAISARKAQREIDRTNAQLALEERKRAVVREIKAAWQEYVAGELEVKNSRELVQKSNDSYHALVQDYRDGVVTNLDVLNAIRQVENAKRRLIDAEGRNRVSQARLRVAVGGIHRDH